jgi:hypothetical protein
MPRRRIDQTPDERKGYVNQTVADPGHAIGNTRANVSLPFVSVMLRNGVEIEAPLAVVLGFLDRYGRIETLDPSRPASFGEPDLRLANRGGARISAIQIAAVLERRRAIERALRAIPHAASLAGSDVPWTPLRGLFHAFAGIPGVGYSKMTKSLHAKRPALIPILDSVVQRYLADDDLGARAPFAERGIGFVRGFERDLDRNRSALGATRRRLASRGHDLTEVRILDLLVWSTEAVGLA